VDRWPFLKQAVHSRKSKELKLKHNIQCKILLIDFLILTFSESPYFFKGTLFNLADFEKALKQDVIIL